MKRKMLVAVASIVFGATPISLPAAAATSSATSSWIDGLGLPPGLRVGVQTGTFADTAEGEGWLHNQDAAGRDVWLKQSETGCGVMVRAEAMSEVTQISLVALNSHGISVGSEPQQRAVLDRLLPHMPKVGKRVYFHPKGARRYVVDLAAVKDSYDAIGPFNKFVFYVSGGMMGAVVAFSGKRFDEISTIDLQTSERFSRIWSKGIFKAPLKKVLDDSQRSSFD